jgi:uncharacterized protein (TIGR03435 family)
VKQNTSLDDTGQWGIMPPTPGRLRIINTPLRFILHYAFAVRDHQLIGAPGWADSVGFDITATYPADPPRTEDDGRAMLRTLLADRFRLVAHAETRELPVYAMVLAGSDRRLGPQLHPSGPECALPKGPPGVPPPPPPPAGPATIGRPLPITAIITSRCPLIAFRTTSGSHWSLREITMAGLAQRLIEPLGRPVLDRTGLAGAFDVDLTFTPDNAVVDASTAPNAPSLMAALREQLGLRLESIRAPIEVLVIDRVQPPTQN